MASAALRFATRLPGVLGAAALLFIGLGFWQVYFRAKPACVDGTYCARPNSLRLTKVVLWAAAVLVALALSVNWWAPFLY